MAQESTRSGHRISADIVIVGAGLAGLVAAIDACTQGADVILLEKLPDPERWNAVGAAPGGIGNDTWRSGGGGLSRFDLVTLVEHLSGGTEELAAGRDPVDILVDRHRWRGWEDVDPVLLRTYCNRIAADCCWLRDEVGLPYDRTGRVVKDVGIGLFRWLHRTAVERGARIEFASRAGGLIRDHAGTVVGIRASSDGKAMEIPTGAVVLATGGFQGSRDMMISHAGRTLGEDVPMVGSPDNTGDGLAMALDAGAATRHLGVCHVRTTDIYFGQGPSRYLAHIYPLGIYFNRNFERFVDEGTADSDTIANAIALQPGNIAGLIFDDKARQRFPEEFARYPRGEQVIKSADSIVELAKLMHVAPERLCRLVEVFNANVSGEQASGPNMAKTASAMRLDTPPYHGFNPVRPAVNHTLGGLVVDGRTCQVVDVDGRPIDGLYAAGTVMNWANGRPYETNGVTSFRGSYHAGGSSGAGFALVTGRLAARSALQRARNRTGAGEPLWPEYLEAPRKGDAQATTA